MFHENGSDSNVRSEESWIGSEYHRSGAKGDRGA